jgi:hypothetical protein
VHGVLRVFEERSLAHGNTTSWSYVLRCQSVYQRRISPRSLTPYWLITSVKEDPSSRNEDDSFLVECLTPLRKIVAPYPLSLDYIVARQVESENAPLTVMPMALVRDCLLGNSRESLEEADHAGQ